MARHHPCLLIVGLDAVTPALFGRWVADGRLPVLGALAGEGTWAPLRSVPNACSPAAWTTFMTGTNPGRHGIFDFTEGIPGTYRQRPVNGSMRDGVPFWQLLSGEGFRVGVVNVPMTYPAESVNGFMLAGMDTPSVQAPGFASPPDLLPRLEQALGASLVRDVMTRGIGFEVLQGRLERALEITLARLEMRTRVAEYLLGAHDLDVFVLVHTETDSAQHYFWKFGDPAHPDYRPEEAQRYGDYILRVYQKADESLGRVRQAFGSGATVMVLSDHGAGIEQHRVRFLRSVLRESGLYAGAASPGRGSLRRRLARRLYEWVNPRLPRGVGRVVRTRGRRVVSPLTGGLREGTRWSATRAYPTSYGGIAINLKGREPEGTVEPGAEYEGLRDELIAQLRSITDATTGTPIVAGVYRREEIYTGPHVHRAPDLYVQLDEELGAFRAFRLGSRLISFPPVRAASPLEAMSGGHRRDGILLLAGEGIRPQAQLAHPALADVAPTALYAVDAGVPHGLDGRILQEAFTPTAAARPVRWRETGEQARETQTFSAAEEALVEQRLRALGYL